MNSETFLFSLPNYKTLIYDENRRVSKFSTWDWIPTSRFSSKSAKFTNPNNCFNQFKSTEYTGKLMWELVYSLQGPMCVVAMQWRVFLAVNLSEISFILLSLYNRHMLQCCCYYYYPYAFFTFLPTETTWLSKMLPPPVWPDWAIFLHFGQLFKAFGNK